MVKYFYKIIIYILLLTTHSHCKMHKELPEFRTEISEPNKKYEVTPILDQIKTLEGVPAGLPYGSTSGEWGSSGAMWTEQHGTPIGFDITYYSRYEDKYYKINQDFDLEFIKKMTNRCYPTSDNGEDSVKEFISLDQYNDDFERYRYTYQPFSTLVFGFAPKGMIVVWMRYAFISYEIGRFKAMEITDLEEIKKVKKIYMEKYRIHPERYEEAKKSMYLPDVSPDLWDNYRLKYKWSHKVNSENRGAKFFELGNEYFNGEYEVMFGSLVAKPISKDRAVPEVIHLFWETGKNERYIARIFFDWEKTNELLKNSGVKENIFNIKIKEDNSQLSINLNGKPIEVDSIRIYPNSHMRFRDSYEE